MAAIVCTGEDCDRNGHEPWDCPSLVTPDRWECSEESCVVERPHYHRSDSDGWSEYVWTGGDEGEPPTCPRCGFEQDEPSVSHDLVHGCGPADSGRSLPETEHWGIDP